jgi:hypothetical protein
MRANAKNAAMQGRIAFARKYRFTTIRRGD